MQVDRRSKMEYKEGFTHGGVFHADDVFATALLRILNPAITIRRGFCVPEKFSGIVYDIGGGEYDHHQKNKRIRDNEIPYAAFGLLWRDFGEEILCAEDAAAFDEEFIQPLDLSDNTGKANQISLIIADRNILWDEQNGDNDAAFFAAVDFAKEILQFRFKKIQSERKAYETVRFKAEQCSNQILILDKGMPWKNAVQDLDILFVIYPTLRGGYNVQAVPKDNQSNELKLSFPPQWRGADREQLQKLTGISDIEFCHGTGFLCTVKSMESAKRLANIMINKRERGNNIG
jgi:uncharacterized UPF0160 family protein